MKLTKFLSELWFDSEILSVLEGRNRYLAYGECLIYVLKDKVVSGLVCRWTGHDLITVSLETVPGDGFRVERCCRRCWKYFITSC